MFTNAEEWIAKMSPDIWFQTSSRHPAQSTLHRMALPNLDYTHIFATCDFYRSVRLTFINTSSYLKIGLGFWLRVLAF